MKNVRHMLRFLGCDSKGLLSQTKNVSTAVLVLICILVVFGLTLGFDTEDAKVLYM
jgi:hypothetical protein